MYDQDPPPHPSDPPVPVAEDLPKDERELAVLVHLLGLCGLTGIPMGHLLGPLVLWLVKKEDMPYLNDQGKEAVNFQITWTIIGFITGVVFFVLALTGIGLCLAIPLAIAVFVVWLVFLIRAAIAANKGEYYRYPMTIRFLS